MIKEENRFPAKIGSLVKYHGNQEDVGLVVGLSPDFVDIYWANGQKSMIGYSGIMMGWRTIRLRHWQCRDILIVLAQPKEMV